MSKNEVFSLDAEFVAMTAIEFVDELAEMDYLNELREIEFERKAMQKAALAYENRFWWLDDVEVAA